MSAPLAFVDTETTGLDPDQHVVWEIAVILEPEGTEHLFHVEPSKYEMGHAEPDPAQFDWHTALGDARWAQAMYHAVVA